MEQHAKLDRGFTLIEVLVALFLFFVVLLGLLGAFLKAYEYIVKNEARNEAIRLVEQELEKYRNIDFSTIVPVSTDCSSSSEKKKVQIRNNYIEFILAKTITDEVAGSVKKIEVTACWEYKGKKYLYKAQTLITPY